MEQDQVFSLLSESTLIALRDYIACHDSRGTQKFEGDYRMAKLGGPVLTTYGRVRATRANERALTLAEQRASAQMALDPGPALAGQSDQGVRRISNGSGKASGEASVGGARKTGRKSA